jgi:hypothetical protein
MFAALGIVLTAYVAYALLRGEVWAKRGARLGGVVHARASDPKRFWTTIAIYGALAVALLTVF